jgi:hypothetical protein
MATPGSVLSNIVTVSEDAAPFTISITVAPMEVPYTGGTVSVAATTNLPDGTTLNLLVNGANAGTTTSSGGAAGFSYAVPANSTTLAVPFTFQVTN